MYAIFWLINTVIDIYLFLLIAWIVLSWLRAFNVINTSNQFVFMVMDFLYRITQPALRPIQRFIPPIGGLDLSPLVLILGLQFFRILLNTTIRHYFF